MKRILLVDSSPAVKETVALLLAGQYEIIRYDGAPEKAALADTAAKVDLVIAGAGPAAWTAELARLAAEDKVAVLLLADTEAVAKSFVCGAGLGCLIKPFTPYDLKATVERLLNRITLSAAAPALAVAAPRSYLEFPFISRTEAHLARRFASSSLPVLIWGELGCGQDRVARAMLSGEADCKAALPLNGVDIGADYLKAKRSELAAERNARGVRPVILIEGLERLSLSGQSMLLNFLDEVEGSHGQLLATANADLLARVYRGEFLDRLYYKLATLTLPLAPLRERRADIAALARWFAQTYGAGLGLDKIRFTPAAVDRLGDYLWFGNVNEFDLVIARTLAIHGKARIDAADLVFDVGALKDTAGFGESGATVESESRGEEKTTVPQSSLIAIADSLDADASQGLAGGAPALRLLVHELAHELKNPMVTIKTFAQLLAERYDDASFRARFQDVVDGDIERMDELLKVITEFAGFDQPRKHSIALKDYLHSTLKAINGDCAKRQVRVGWKGNGQGVKIIADAAQLQYVLKNTLLAVLSQARMGSEIELALGERGSLTISYLREGERIQSLANYLSDATTPAKENILPLRIMLAREIVERSGGRFGMDQTDGDREVVTMEFPVV
jgi:DNA-binding NtrC family response regulator